MIALADLLLALKVEGDAPAEEQALVRDYERAAVAYCERDTGRYFGPEKEVIQYLDGVGQRDLWLVNEPVAGSVSVTQNGVAVDAAQYEVRGRVLAHTAVWGHVYYPTQVVVTYRAGYTVPDPVGAPDVWTAPDDIQQAVRMITAHWYETRVPVALGTVAPEIKMTVGSILQPWRRL